MRKKAKKLIREKGEEAALVFRLRAKLNYRQAPAQDTYERSEHFHH